jgi:hypothetical protein
MPDQADLRHELGEERVAKEGTATAPRALPCLFGWGRPVRKSLEAMLEDEGVEYSFDGGLVLLGQCVDLSELFEQLSIRNLRGGASVGPVLESEVVEGDIKERGVTQEFQLMPFLDWCRARDHAARRGHASGPRALPAPSLPLAQGQRPAAVVCDAEGAANGGAGASSPDAPEEWVDPNSGEWRLKLKGPSAYQDIHPESQRSRYAARTASGQYIDPATGKFGTRKEVGHQEMTDDRPQEHP